MASIFAGLGRRPFRVKNVAVKLQQGLRRVPVKTAAGRRFGVWRKVLAKNRHVYSRISGLGILNSRGLHRHGFLAHGRLAGLLMKSDEEAKKLVEQIRELFEDQCTVPDGLQDFPVQLNGYEIDKPISKGCNAVVLAAKIADTPERTLIKPKCEFLPCSVKSSDAISDAIAKFPLAIKMVFNYSVPSNEAMIVREFSRELVPVTSKDIRDLMICDEPMRDRHPNIIQIFASFVDEVRMYPGLDKLCPTALPPNLHPDGVGRNHTLFIVMKRYRMTLREYMLTKEFKTRSRLVLLAQLLEAVRFLQVQKIAHRDLKSNNVLLEYDLEEQDPKLVVSDFGCCLSDGGFTLPYFHNDMDLGGNLALRPPEISLAVPGFWKLIDFSRADLWAAGAMAFELFTNINPFYGRLDSKTYAEDDLPVLSQEVPYPAKKIIKRILNRDPRLRPTPECAANVLALALFGTDFLSTKLDFLNRSIRQYTASVKFSKSDAGQPAPYELKSPERENQYGHFVSEAWRIGELMKNGNGAREPREDAYDEGHGSGMWLGVSDALALYAAETMLAKAVKTISPAEAELRSRFLARVDLHQICDSAGYFGKQVTTFEVL